MTTFSYNDNYIQYLCGDVFDENSWGKLRGQKFNIIFSDAFHSPKGLKFEYEMLKKYQLSNSNIAINSYNGWLGQHEDKHLNGIIFKI